MAWTPPVAQTPTSIPRLTVVLSDRLAIEEEPASQTANYSFVLLDQDGKRIAFGKDAGDLVLHITTAQRTALMDLMTALRTQAETQILGV